MSPADADAIAQAIAWAIDHHCDTLQKVQGARHVAEELARMFELRLSGFLRQAFLARCGFTLTGAREGASWDA